LNYRYFAHTRTKITYFYLKDISLSIDMILINLNFSLEIDFVIIVDIKLLKKRLKIT